MPTDYRYLMQLPAAGTGSNPGSGIDVLAANGVVRSGVGLQADSILAPPVVRRGRG